MLTARVLRVAILALSAALSAALAAAQIAPTTAEIDAALRAQNYDRALQLLRPQLGSSPQNSLLWTLDGIALSGKGDSREALAAYRRALAISPDSLPALEGAAQLEYELGDKQASPHLERILTLRPSDPTTHAMLAVLAYRRGDCGVAVRHFESSQPLLDSRPEALEEYGECLLERNQAEKAVAVLNRALLEGKDEAVLRGELASAQIMAHHPKDAILTLQPLLREKPGDAQLLDLMSSAYEADGNTPQAVELLRRALAADPHNLNLYLDFATLSLDHKSYQVGIDVIDAGLKLEPKAARLYVARGVLYVQLSQYDRAQADFDKADALDPRRAVGGPAQGLTAVEKHDPARALQAVRTKLAHAPKSAYLWYAQAQILMQLGPAVDSPQFREALQSAKTAIALDPGLADAYDLLGKLSIQQGMADPAIAYCRKALRIDPKNEMALYHLIQALNKSGRTQDLPDLLRRLDELREENTQEETEHSRYTLFEKSSPATSRP